MARTLNAGFLASGNDARIWYFAGSDDRAEEATDGKIIVGNRHFRFYYLRLLWSLFWELKRERPDVVIAHTTNSAVPGLLLASLASVYKRIAVQHNPLDTYGGIARLSDRFCANTGVFWRNIVVAQAVWNTTNSYNVKALSRLRLIHNGLARLNLAPVDSNIHRTAIRQKFGLPVDLPLVVAIGRLAEQKNQSVLIDVMCGLDGVVLAIAGHGPLREELDGKIARTKLGGRVRMLGAIGPADVRMLLQAADVFVTPSHFEAMPMIVLEAMQESRPIVASDIDAHRELIRDAGLMVPPTIEGFSNALQRLLQDAALRERLSQRAAERALIFSEEAMIEAYLKVLREDNSQ